jgi:hypothetical protein
MMLAASGRASWPFGCRGRHLGISQPIEEWGLIPIRLRANKRSIEMDCGPIVTIDHVAELGAISCCGWCDHGERKKRRSQYAQVHREPPYFDQLS